MRSVCIEKFLQALNVFVSQRFYELKGEFLSVKINSAFR